MVRLFAPLLVLCFSFVMAFAPAVATITIGDWRVANSQFVVDSLENELIAGVGDEAAAGLGWIEENFLDSELELWETGQQGWHKPPSPIIPLYMAQYKDYKWWSTVLIEVKVVGNAEEFEIKVLSELLSHDITVQFMYSQPQGVYNKNYMYRSVEISGNNRGELFSSFDCVPLMEYGTHTHEYSGEYGRFFLPPFEGERIMRLCVTNRPGMEAFMPLLLSSTDVLVRISDGDVWA